MGSATLQTYLQHLGTLGIDTATFVPDARGTLADRSMSQGLEFSGRSDLVLGQTLGEGGMGLVREGTQMALERSVAVKTVRPDRDSPGARAGLLREAWVTGYLQHPNIPPIYTLSSDERGGPIIVMKRIEGVPWSELLRHPELHTDALGGATDLLEAHLGVLDRVCQAVHFAHSMRVIHRDLKPENVMLGTFGEVYVLDWGIALALGDKLLGPLPPVAWVKGVEGTPAYMAPEMAGVDAARLGIPTDVFLLGGMLHEVLTGRPRNDGPDIPHVLAMAYEAVPFDYGADVDPELARIANRATARDPAQRFETAESFRLALQEFRAHRASVLATRRAEQRTRQLERLLDADRPDPVAVADLAGEARFGFRLAIEGWPASEEALRGHRQLLTLMCRYELSRDNLDAARDLFGQLQDPPADLAAGLERLETRAAERRASARSFHALRHDLDKRVGARARRSGNLLSALVLVVVGLAAWLAERRGVVHIGYLGYFAPLLGMIALAVLTERLSGERNRTSRQQVVIVVVGELGMIVVGLLCMALGLAIHQAVPIGMAVAGIITATLTALYFRSLAPASVLFFACAGIMAAWPDGLWLLLGLFGGLGFVAMARAWGAVAELETESRG